ncbi:MULTISPECIES: anibiotic ABC transporter [unclassified Actinomadura]|uniref:ABC transporter permease n=1 Tax=unclassified Actinomadura TaxID=2626254 RepID=UPI0011EBB524|nr:anibiotic ABC transporter [Actinomadura sp. K4S16]
MMHPRTVGRAREDARTRGAERAPSAPRRSRARERRPTAFAGTIALTRLAVRYDRVRLPAWTLGTAAILCLWVTSVVASYPTAQDRMGQARVFARSAAARAVDGAVSGTGIGSLVMAEVLISAAAAVGLISTFAVVRLTRAHEEAGRADLVGAGAVGRCAAPAAALLRVLGANVLLVPPAAGALIVNGLPAAGSFAAAAGLGGVGVACGAMAAVAAQLTATARGANLLAVALVAAAFLVRAVGDVMGHVGPGGVSVEGAWPSWLSPIGWCQKLSPYAGERWWVLALFAVFSGAAAALAFRLAAHREIGAGVLPAREAAEGAPRSLRGPIGLAWRIQRAHLLGWAIAFVALGATFGGIGAEAEEIVRTSDQLTTFADRLGGAEPVQVWFTFHMGLTAAILTARFTVQALQKMRAEEAAGRLGPLLTAGVGRSRWLLAHVLWVAAGTVGLLLLIALSAAAAYGAASGDATGELGAILGGAAARIPAEFVVGGAAIAVFGLAGPRARVPMWLVFVVAVVLGPLAMFGDLPQPLLDVSPFTHVHEVPAGPVGVVPVLGLLAAACAFTAVGLLAFRRRDLAG